MVRPDRFELPTFWFVARRSIQLSYGRNVAGTTPPLYPTVRYSRNLARAYRFSGSSTHGGVASIRRPSSGSTSSIFRFISQAISR